MTDELTLESIGDDPIRGDISNLTTSHLFFVSCAFLEVVSGGFRLVVIKGKKVIKDKIYRTLRGARISFAREYWRPWFQFKRPTEWSHFYPPDPGWVDDKLKLSGAG